MKAKTYGKRSRNVPNAFFGEPSPSSETVRPIQSVLVEKSENSRVLKPRTNILEEQVWSNCSKENDDDQSTSTESTIAWSSSNACLRYRKASNTSDALENVLASAIKQLSLDSQDTTVRVKAKVAPKKTKPPLITQRPAKVDECTRSYVSPLLLCKNVGNCIEDFQSWTDERENLLDIQKIGEGSFGEVYKAISNETVILKLMPLNAKSGKGSRSYTTVESAANELQLLERMQKVPGFVAFRGACILQGRMPKQFVTMWNEYLESGRTVESKDPNKKVTYPANQLWLLIEMSDAGRNLNPGQFVPADSSAFERGRPYLSIHHTWDIFWQIVKALAKAEVYSEFEHRDLHLGNICVKEAPCNTNKTGPEKVGTTQKQEFGLNKTGIEVTLIDYSLSRASMSDNDQVLFYDFSKDKNLLKGQGDYQYDIYRYMAEIVGDKSCREFNPRTNVLWLYYVLRMLLLVTHGTLEEHSTKEGGTVESQMMTIMKDLKSTICPEIITTWATDSAGALLDLGIQRQWFLPEDVVDK